jgi:Tfp pilus assembly protein PilP
MKRTTSILTCLMVAGLAWAQNPQIIQNTRTKLQTVEKKATAASNEALGDNGKSKPAAGVHNTAVKAGTSPFKAGSTTPALSKPAPVQKLAPAQSKPAPVQTKSSGAVAVKPAANAKSAPAQSKPAPAQTKSSGVVAGKPAADAKSAKVAAEPKKMAPAPKSSPPAAAASSSESSAASAGEEAKKEDQESPDKKWSMSGKRDPFVSPVVSHMGGSGCSTGKKCLEIGAINLRGVVRSEAGFIAVVTNSLNKAYFLRENDPVFDGYVVKITDDSITFKEMLQDRLGKTLTREVVKKIATPAV